MINECNPDRLWLMEPKALSEHISRVAAQVGFPIEFINPSVSLGGGFALFPKDGIDVSVIEQSERLFSLRILKCFGLQSSLVGLFCSCNTLY